MLHQLPNGNNCKKIYNVATVASNVGWHCSTIVFFFNHFYSLSPLSSLSLGWDVSFLSQLSLSSSLFSHLPSFTLWLVVGRSKVQRRRELDFRDEQPLDPLQSFSPSLTAVIAFFWVFFVARSVWFRWISVWQWSTSCCGFLDRRVAVGFWRWRSVSCLGF